MELSLSLSLGFGSRQREDEHIVLDLNVNRVPTADVAEDGTEAVTGSAHSEEEENGSSRKKLRLSREQSVFLEESFKEHNTLNPKQKVAVAKQLNLRPRQVEVWFQNRRARTKLKQTEVDCEYLKHCCEALTEENRRLHKELSELRALKTPSTSFSSSHSPATTLSMCPSCERTTPVKSSRESNNTASFASLITAKPQYHATPFAAS